MTRVLYASTFNNTLNPLKDNYKNV